MSKVVYVDVLFEDFEFTAELQVITDVEVHMRVINGNTNDTRKKLLELMNRPYEIVVGNERKPTKHDIVLKTIQGVFRSTKMYGVCPVKVGEIFPKDKFESFDLKMSYDYELELKDE